MAYLMQQLAMAGLLKVWNLGAKLLRDYKPTGRVVAAMLYAYLVLHRAAKINTTQNLCTCEWKNSCQDEAVQTTHLVRWSKSRVMRNSYPSKTVQ